MVPQSLAYRTVHATHPCHHDPSITIAVPSWDMAHPTTPVPRTQQPVRAHPGSRITTRQSSPAGKSLR